MEINKFYVEKLLHYLKISTNYRDPFVLQQMKLH